jgi:hypothetical protein
LPEHRAGQHRSADRFPAVANLLRGINGISLFILKVYPTTKGEALMPITTMTPPAKQTQAPMPLPPRVITTKDYNYLKDALSWELVAFKKFHFFAQQVKDPQIKQALEKAGQMHQRHYQQLLTHLQVDNTAAMANIPQPQQAQQQSPQQMQ